MQRRGGRRREVEGGTKKKSRKITKKMYFCACLHVSELLTILAIPPQADLTVD